VLNAVPLQADAYSALLVSGNNIYQVGGETAGGLSTGNQAYQAIYTISVPIIGSGK
jgi:N-acetylneuraminic acid mutarotase